MLRSTRATTHLRRIFALSQTSRRASTQEKGMTFFDATNAMTRSFSLIEQRMREDATFDRLKVLSQKLDDSNLWSDPAAAQPILKEHSALKTKVEKLENLKREFETNTEMYKMAQEESDESFQAETLKSLQKLFTSVQTMEIETLLTDPLDQGDCALEIHAGAGGTESCDWAEMLMRMYLRFADRRGYKAHVIDELKSEIAGIKSASIRIEGENAFGWLKTESGVHRLVRVSPFDANGKRHTSFAAVSVFPLSTEGVDIEINPKDLRIDTFRASGAGGQHVNKTESGVRITHIPTGIVASQTTDRSQHRNRALAMEMLKAKLVEAERRKKSDNKAAFAASLGEIAWGNQIRSYVLYPYQMVKDLRTGFETNDPADVLDGNIDEFMRSNLAAGEKGYGNAPNVEG